MVLVVVLACAACSSDDSSWQVVALEVDFPAEIGGWQVDTTREGGWCRFDDFDTNRFTARAADGTALPQDPQVAEELRRSRPLNSATGRLIDGRCRTSINLEVTTADPVVVTLVHDGEPVDSISTQSFTWKEVGGADLDWSPGSPWIVDP